MNQPNVVTIFDRASLRRHRDRAAPGLTDHDFLFQETAERLADRLDDVKRSFPLALDLGCHGGEVGRLLNGRGGVEMLIQCDLSQAMARTADRDGSPALVGDEEFLPFGPNSFDLIVSNMNLHWVNDLPGALIQIRRALKPGGMFLANMLGGETLAELRNALGAAELAIEGGLSPRVSPSTDIRDVGNLLARAGFTIPVADSEIITVSYGDPIRLMKDLRGMGETNAVAERRKSMSRRSTLLSASARYVETHADENGRVPATFEVISMIGWAPPADDATPTEAPNP